MHLSLFDLAYELRQYCFDVADLHSCFYSDLQLASAFVIQFLLLADDEVALYFDLSPRN